MDRFVHACTAGNARRARSVLSRQSRLVEQLDADDRNLVAHVAQMGSWAAVRLMIDIGWPVDAEGWMGATPLTWALCYGDAKMVDFLLARGAGLASVGDYFENPLHTVIHCRWRPGDHAAALERLLREGIDVPDDVFPCGDADLDRVLETHLRHAARRQAR